MDVYARLGAINGYCIRANANERDEGASVDEEFGFDCREKNCSARERSVPLWNTSRSVK